MARKITRRAGGRVVIEPAKKPAKGVGSKAKSAGAAGATKADTSAAGGK